MPHTLNPNPSSFPFVDALPLRRFVCDAFGNKCESAMADFQLHFRIGAQPSAHTAARKPAIAGDLHTGITAETLDDHVRRYCCIALFAFAAAAAL